MRKYKFVPRKPVKFKELIVDIKGKTWEITKTADFTPQKTRNFRTWCISEKNDKILCTFFAHCEKCKFVDCGFRFSFRNFYPRISRAQNVQNLQNLQISEKLGQKSAGFGPKFSPKKRQIHTVIFCGRRKKIQKKPVFK